MTPTPAPQQAPKPGGLTSVLHFETSTTPSVWKVTRSQRVAFSPKELRVRRRVVDALHACKTFKGNRLTRYLDCCSVPMLAIGTNGQPVVTTSICRERLCPRCNRGRAASTAERVSQIALRMDAPRFITLTIKHNAGETLDAVTDRLFDGFRRLRLDKRWKQRVKGGVWTYEVTRGTNGEQWHAHLHILADGDYYPQQELSIDWAKATNGSMIVDIRRVDSRGAAAKYITKYIAKGCDVEQWSTAEILEFAIGIYRRRTMGTFGTAFRRVTDDEATEESGIAVSNIIGVQRVIDAAENGNEHAQQIMEYAARTCPLVGRLSSNGWAQQIEPRTLEPWEVVRMVNLIEWFKGDSLVDPLKRTPTHADNHSNPPEPTHVAHTLFGPSGGAAAAAFV